MLLNRLTELYPVADSVETADSKTPISVFTSFYSNNPDRIVNLARCCELISKVLQPGESMNFNNVVSPFSAANGYKLAPVLKDGETKMGDTQGDGEEHEEFYADRQSIIDTLGKIIDLREAEE